MFNNLTFCRFSEISACGPSPISLSKHILFWNLYLCRPEKKKRSRAAVRKRVNMELQEWIKSIGNHFWWSCSSCGGDETVMPVFMTLSDL